MNQRKIAIIGGGNLGAAIAEGLLLSGFSDPHHLVVTKRHTDTLKNLASKGVKVTSDNKSAVDHSDVVIIALKPYNVREVLRDIRSSFQQHKHLVISVVTGIKLSEFEDVIGKSVAIIRAMPNTAIAIRESITCICHNGSGSSDISYVESLFNQLGKAIIIDEKLMDAATVLGACGIAYALRFIRAATQGGIEIGFDAQTASLIAAQTVKGAADLLLQGNKHPEEEIDKVTTPKGCTIAGLNEMEHQGFSSSLIKGIGVSFDKIGN